MQLRNSPIARTPPKNYPNFPASLMKGVDIPKESANIIPSPIKKGEHSLYLICNLNFIEFKKLFFIFDMGFLLKLEPIEGLVLGQM
jgi:hypothetical protein